MTAPVLVALAVTVAICLLIPVIYWFTGKRQETCSHEWYHLPRTCTGWGLVRCKKCREIDLY